MTADFEPPAELKAAPDRCEEASPLSREKYIPCNAPAVAIIYHDRDRREYRMCAPCADHNVRNRGGKMVGPYKSAASPSQHNMPPADPLTDALRERHASLVQETSALALKAGALTEIADETQLAASSQLVADMTALEKKVDRVRITEKEPHLEASRKIDRFFKFTDALDPVKLALKRLQGRYQIGRAHV